MPGIFCLLKIFFVYYNVNCCKMLNNLTNFFNIITSRMVKTVLEPNDLIAIGTRDAKYGGNYKPTAIKFSDLQDQVGGYKSYIVSLGQDGTSDPYVWIEFQNSLQVQVEFVREDVGIYSLYFDKDIFNSPFDYCVIQNPVSVDVGDPSFTYVAKVEPTFINTAMITTTVDGVLSDEAFVAPLILEIRVYPNPIFFD